MWFEWGPMPREDGSGSSESGGRQVACRWRRGMPSWRNSASSCPTTRPSYSSVIRPSPVKAPIAVASTSRLLQICCRRGQAGGRHGQHHALLGLAEPDLPGAQPGVLEGHALQVYLCAQHRRHLADGRREAACAAVGDGGVQAFVAGEQHRFERLLLVDRVADLHGAAGNLACTVIHLHGGEGRPAQPVPAGPPPDHHHQVARLPPRPGGSRRAGCPGSRRTRAGWPYSPDRTGWRR